LARKSKTGEVEYKEGEEWVKAPGTAQFTSTAITGTKEEALGLTKSNITELHRALEKDKAGIVELNDLIDKVEKSPGAVGIRGALGETTAGLIGQMGPLGEEIAGYIESDDEIEVRAGLRMLTGKLVAAITGDTSGRYSDKDMELVKEVNRGLKLSSSKVQTIGALKKVRDVMERGKQRGQEMLGETPKKSGGYSDLWGD
jgi:hypothetical protein